MGWDGIRVDALFGGVNGNWNSTKFHETTCSGATNPDPPFGPQVWLPARLQ